MLTFIQSDPQVPAGVFAAYLAEKNIPYRIIRLFAGESVPVPDLADTIIVLGGNMGVNDEEQYPFLLGLKDFMRAALASDVHLLGICLGGQLLADVAGGRFTSRTRGEKGLCAVTLTAAAAGDPLMAGLPPSFAAFQWHNDSFDPPPAATLLASSPLCPGQAFRLGNAWGVQFHPEVDASIVTDWCDRDATAHPLKLAFARGEAEHRALALRLFENFLVTARELPAN